jgi:tetratricopeptide (TPR) repeat protein
MIHALFSIGIGQWKNVEESVDSCQEIAEKVGDTLLWCNAQVIRFWLHYYRSEWILADEASPALLTRAERTDNRQQQAWGLRATALMALRAGALHEAEEGLRRSLELMSRDREPTNADLNELAPTWGALALTHLLREERSEARQAAQRAVELTRRMGRPTGHAALSGWVALSEVALDWLKETPDAAEALGLCDDISRGLQAHQGVFDMARPAYHLFVGRFAEARSRRRHALKHYRNGRDAAERLGLAAEAREFERRLS